MNAFDAAAYAREHRATGVDGFDGSGGFGGYSGKGVGDRLCDWFGTYTHPWDARDLHLFTLWTLHTWTVAATYTTPRLLLHSPVPESGKTTVLEHLAHLCFAPVQTASVSTPAVLVRLLHQGPRTILLDEAEKNLRPDREGVGDLLAVLNSGYKRGATRPVSVPDGNGGWTVAEMPTFACVAMAGNNPLLPDDTASRTIVALMLPDTEGKVAESDWERLDGPAAELAEAARQWADSTTLPDEVPLPEGCVGRIREKWRPLARVAAALGGPWPDRCAALIRRDIENLAHDREDGMNAPPTVVLLRDLAAVWPEGQHTVRSADLVRLLHAHNPEQWNTTTEKHGPLTVQRLGRMLGKGFGVRTGKDSKGNRIGYTASDLTRVWRRFGVTPPHVIAETADTDVTAVVCRACREPMTHAEPGATTHPTCRNPEGAAA